jgi:hypothetical protein
MKRLANHHYAFHAVAASVLRGLNSLAKPLFSCSCGFVRVDVERRHENEIGIRISEMRMQSGWCLICWSNVALETASRFSGALELFAF